MPRKRVNKSPSVERKSDDDDDFFFDESQSNSGRNSVEPQHRNAANARERARMRVLSKAFCRLKTTLPWVPADTKLSKLDTLRLAASYIAHLRALLNDEPRSSQVFPHPLNLAWPFAFQHGGALSCSISPRWNVPPQPDITPSDTRPDQGRYPDNYQDCRDYQEMYDKRYEANMADDGEPAMYCNYGYKENYYEMKNAY